MKEKFIEELKFCIHLSETQGHCEFRGHTRCEQCASPYLLLKLITCKVLHGKDIQRLTLEDWKSKIKTIESSTP